MYYTSDVIKFHKTKIGINSKTNMVLLRNVVVLKTAGSESEKIKKISKKFSINCKGYPFLLH